MTRAEIEAAAKAQAGEAKLLCLVIGLLLDLRESLIQLRHAVEARDTWTRAVPQRAKGAKR